MKNKFFLAGIIALLLLASFGFTAARFSSSWEYKVETNSEYSDDKTEELQLNFDGGHGWELVAVEQTAHGHRYFFKRQK